MRCIVACLLALAFCGVAAAQGTDTTTGQAEDSVVPIYPVTVFPPSPESEDKERRREQVVAGLSHDSVEITAKYDRMDILIYGAIKRETPIPSGSLDVIVTVEAPSRPLTIWRKERKAGIWINADKVEIGAAPGFYAVASSAPLDKILEPDWDRRYRISLPLALRAYAGQIAVEDAVPFTEALIRIRKNNGLYRLDESAVTLVDQTLFRADVRLPANLIEGDYKTRIFLLRDGKVIDVYRAPIEVRKVGLERWLYRLAFDQPLLYGLMSLAVAVFAGWGASAAFRKLRRA